MILPSSSTLRCYHRAVPDTHSIYDPEELLEQGGQGDELHEEPDVDDPEIEEAVAVTMLRLRPTQITLNPRDTEWHQVRHENRQGLRARGQLVSVTTTQLPHDHSSPQLDEGLLPYGFPRPPSSQLPSIQGLQLPLFATDEERQRYWSRIGAETGGHPQMRSVISGRPNMINNSPSSQSMMEASSASFESDDGSVQELDDPGNNESNYTLRSQDSDGDDREDESKGHSEGDSPIRSTVESGHHHEAHESQVDSAVVQSPHTTRRRRISLPFRRRRASRRDTPEHISQIQRQTENIDFDGSSDRYPHDDDPGSAQSAAESQYTTAHSSLSEDLGPAQELQDNSSVLESNDLEVEHITERLEASSPFNDTPDQSTTMSLPQPRPLSIIRRPAGLPRSPLYISQEAVSSSPEKRPRPDDDGVELSESLEALSIHPRRSKRYKRRSQSYPYMQSEADNAHSSQNDGSTQDHHHSTRSDLPNVQLPVSTDDDSHLLNPQASNSSLHSASYGSSVNSFTDSSPTHRSLSPLATPFTPRHIRSPMQPPLPPYAFSAVRRTVSFASPSNSSSRSPTSPSRFQTPPYNRRVGRLRTPPHPRTPQYVVYDDRLPASLQPQTPVGLPSNGIPSGGLPGVGLGGAYTAPVGGSRRSLGALRDGGNRDMATPTRRRRGLGGAQEQENERHGPDMERAWRRQAGNNGREEEEEEVLEE
ncbi:MAG: hypothetical protein Q9195_004335 [Heterodermia aff. obscurata]